MALGACMSQYVATGLEVVHFTTVSKFVSPFWFSFFSGLFCIRLRLSLRQGSSTVFFFSFLFRLCRLLTLCRLLQWASGSTLTSLRMHDVFSLGAWETDSQCHKNWVRWLGSGIDGETEPLGARLPLVTVSCCDCYLGGPIFTTYVGRRSIAVCFPSPQIRICTWHERSSRKYLKR